jgi:hypothetical protein
VFRVQVYGSEFRVQGFKGSGFRVQGPGFRIQGIRVEALGLKV